MYHDKQLIRHSLFQWICLCENQTAYTEASNLKTFTCEFIAQLATKLIWMHSDIWQQKNGKLYITYLRVTFFLL